MLLPWGRLEVTSQPSVNWPDFKSLGVYQKQCGERLTAPMRAEASAIARESLRSGFRVRKAEIRKEPVSHPLLEPPLAHAPGHRLGMTTLTHWATPLRLSVFVMPWFTLSNNPD